MAFPLIETPHAGDVELVPSATAMVWLGPDEPHQAIAVPGVRLAAGELLVTVELATICGSDVHTVQGHRGAPTPLILGHEYVGRIAEVGPTDVAALDGRPLAVGERVVWSILASCGRCDRCRAAIPQKCRSVVKYGHERIAPGWELSGGFATHMHLRAGTAVVRVDENLPAEILAPLSCGTATAFAALDHAGAVREVDDATVLITGAGLIGLTATAMAADRGAMVIVSDPDPGRRALALRFGAALAVDPRDGATALARALTQLGRAEVDVVVEASGARAAVGGALEVVGVGGVIVLVGSVFPSAPVPLDPERIVRGLVSLRGVHNYAPEHLAGAADYLRTRGRAHPFVELVGNTFALADLDAAMIDAASGGAVRVAIRPR